MKSKKIRIIVTVSLVGIILAMVAIWYLGSVSSSVTQIWSRFATLAQAVWHSGTVDSPATEAKNEDQEDLNSSRGHKDYDKHEGHTEHGEEKHKGHDEHEGHTKHDEEKVVRLGDGEMKEFGIEVGIAGPGSLQTYISLPGEVVINADRRAHIVPRVPGVVHEIRKTLGDRVRAGEVMAVLESRELADMRSVYLAAKERVALAEADFRRVEDLWKQKISAEKDYLQVKQALAEARIELRSAEQKLRATGFSEKYLAQLSDQQDGFTRYLLTAPFDGTVIEKHIALGEVLKDDTEAFVIADLSSVWVNLNVYQKDLPFVRKGLSVVISVGHGIPDAKGEIAYVGPIVGEQTRTALARIVLPNPEGHWRPGLFVTGRIAVEDFEVPILVPKTALQTMEDKVYVFVRTKEGFKPQPVTIGRTNETHVEITSGLTPGQPYVTQGAFTLKAQLSKAAFGDGHGH